MKFLALCAGPLLMAAAVSARTGGSSDSSESMSDSVDSSQQLTTMMSETLEEDVSLGSWFVVVKALGKFRL